MFRFWTWDSFYILAPLCEIFGMLWIYPWSLAPYYHSTIPLRKSSIPFILDFGPRVYSPSWRLYERFLECNGYYSGYMCPCILLPYDCVSNSMQCMCVWKTWLSLQTFNHSEFNHRTQILQTTEKNIIPLKKVTKKQS